MKTYSELEVANEFAKLVRLFEITAAHKPELTAGLSCAVGLSQLWCQKYAPGDPCHPFSDFGMDAKSVIQQASLGGIVLRKPRPVEAGQKQEERRAVPRVKPEALSPELKHIYDTVMAQTLQFGINMIREKCPNHITDTQIRSLIYRMHQHNMIVKLAKGKYEVQK